MPLADVVTMFELPLPEYLCT